MREKCTKRQSFHDYEAEQAFKECEAHNYYLLILSHFQCRPGNLAIYEDTIINIVGTYGLSLLREFHLIETCGLLEGRKLYAF